MKMGSIRHMVMACIAATGASAMAAPLVNVQIVGSTTYSATAAGYTSSVSAAPGQTVYYAVQLTMAAIGSVNGTHTISTLPYGTAGAKSLSFNLSDSSVTWNTDNQLQGVWVDAGPSVVNNGTVGPTGITGIIGSINTVSGDKPQGVGSNSLPTLSLVQSGSLVVGATNSSVTGTYGTTTGAFAINNGSPISGNAINVTSGDPSSYYSFTPMTVAVPEPGTIGLASVAVLGLLVRRRHA